MGDVFLAVEDLHHADDVDIGEDVVVRFFFEQRAGVDELGAGVRFVLREHEDSDCDGGAEEETRREGDYRLHVVGVVDFLPEEAVLDDVGIEVFLGLK